MKRESPFELCFEDGPEKQELHQLLDRLNLSRRELALIVLGLRARPGFELKDFDTKRTPAAERESDIEALVKPIVDWIREHHNPHTVVNISWDRVWVREDLLSLPFPYTEL